MPRKITPKEGEKYGELTMTGNFNTGKYYQTMVEVLCFCGKIFYTRFNSIRTGHTTSCGCTSIEARRVASTKHGLFLVGNGKRPPMYANWAAAKQRCLNKKQPNYIDYGGRGITIYKEWADNFENFYEWGISNGWREGLTLERIDVNGNYEPNNCKWVTNVEQQKNKRNSVFLKAFDEVKIMADWGRDNRCKVSVRTVSERLKNGWVPEDALTTIIRY